MTVVSIARPHPAHDVPAQLRELAREIECGELPAEVVLAVIDGPDGIQSRLYGAPIKTRELVGLLHTEIVRLSVPE